MTQRKNLILAIASIGIFIEALDIAIVNLAIPSIQSDYGLSSDKVQWLQTLYVLLYGGFLIIGGKLSDLVGKKNIFLAGCAIFLLTSLGAGLSGSFEMLAFFRAAQGIGAALIMPSAFSIVTHTFTESRERAKAIGIFSSFAAIGSGSGLALGGIITTYWGWHWIFFVNVPVLFIIIGLAWYYLAPDELKKSKSRPDLLSGVLLVIVLLMLSYGVHELGRIREHYLMLIGLTIAVIAGFKIIQHRLKVQAEPLIEVSLFRSKATTTGIGVFFLLGAYFTGYMFLLSLLIQKDMNFSAAKAGVTLVPFSIISALFAKFVLPPLMKRLNVWQTGVFGMSLMVGGAGFLLASVLMDHNFILLLCSAACVSGLGMTICYTSLSVISVQGIPPQHYGLASSLASTSYFLGGGIGLSILSLFISTHETGNSVSNTSILVLCVYAIGALVWLASYTKRHVAVQRPSLAAAAK
ncbi:MFS transporter [Pedobacter gandavensis]|uniref:MFS transporter n=1 Tax=Pedobacter gandavensis TaxID=2679963 RepID=A0ABR6ETX1_9SPHI|nr:MFS transporter [Pedobacter gandavensis]MBB2148715.1 MFS transporter [Pedobacter gandavensis]